MDQTMQSKDDVLKELLRPIVEELVTNTMNAWLAVHPGVTEESVRDIMRRTQSEAASSMLGKYTAAQTNIDAQRERMMQELQYQKAVAEKQRALVAQTIAPGGFQPVYDEDWKLLQKIRKGLGK